MRPWRSDAALNHAALLAAARRMLVEQPEATMAAIAQSAGVSRGTAYRHFPTRQHLIDEVRRQSRRDAAEDESDALRPPGEVANREPTPLSVTDVLNKVAPFQLGDQIVAEAQRLDGVTSAAVYLVDLDGRHLKRLAGADSFPEALPLTSAIGPEIPREGINAAWTAVQLTLPGAVMAPMTLRSRAIGVVVAVGADQDTLRELAREAAVALALADRYTDAGGLVRRTRDTTPAGEMQQILLPPRVLRIAGGTLAGNVRPAYDVSGDLFDYTENPGRAWICLIDIGGRGARASGLAAMALAAFRSARRRDGSRPETVALAMNAAFSEIVEGRHGVDRPNANIAAASWNAPSSTLRWVTCGDIAPVLISASGELQTLGDAHPPLGSSRFPDRLPEHSRRLHPGERVVFASNGLLDQPGPGGSGTFGLVGLQRAVAAVPGASAAATVRAIEDAHATATDLPLHDDAAVVVLAVGGPSTT